MNTASLFMLSLLPFTPTSFMHLAFGISDFDEKRYLITVMLGKGIMVAITALFGQSLAQRLKEPVLSHPGGAALGRHVLCQQIFLQKHNLE